MKKQLTLILALLLALSLVSCGGQPTGSTKDEGDTGTHENPALTDNTDINHTDNGEQTAQAENSISATYAVYIQGDDWGCGVSKAILTLDTVLEDVSDYTFSVTETKTALDWATFSVSETSGERKVTNVYLSDETGMRIEGPSNYVTLELYISPDEGSPFLYNIPNYGLNEWCDPYYLDIKGTNGVNTLMVEKGCTAKSTSADLYHIDSYQTASGISYMYASFAPENESDTLVVWLHGQGEGGTDPLITLLGAETTALIGDEFQEIMGGAHILVPQCPTYWMDNDGKRSNFVDGSILADGTSYYTESLHELINHYRDTIGANKVIIAGCSNGGYMTMRLAMTYGAEYDAYVPICEAMGDNFITDQDIETLKSLPMFFIYAENDPLVVPSEHEIPTIERLKASGAEELHIYAPADVHDTSGRFTGEDGSPYQYYGHGSWQYFFNNEAVCNEDGISCWEWMAQKAK